MDSLLGGVSSRLVDRDGSFGTGRSLNKLGSEAWVALVDAISLGERQEVHALLLNQTHDGVIDEGVDTMGSRSSVPSWSEENSVLEVIERVLEVLH
jgi:hypothetical protein